MGRLLRIARAPALRAALVEVFGRERAVDLIWYVSWCNYMTRVADAFQFSRDRVEKRRCSGAHRFAIGGLSGENLSGKAFRFGIFWSRIPLAGGVV